MGSNQRGGRKKSRRIFKEGATRERQNKRRGKAGKGCGFHLKEKQGRGAHSTVLHGKGHRWGKGRSPRNREGKEQWGGGGGESIKMKRCGNDC